MTQAGNIDKMLTAFDYLDALEGTFDRLLRIICLRSVMFFF